MKIEENIRMDLKTYAIEQDLKLLETKREANRRITQPEYSLLFWPKQWAQQREIKNLDTFRLAEDKLFKFAQHVCQLRQQVRTRALRLAPSNLNGLISTNGQLTKLQRQMHRGHFSSQTEKVKKAMLKQDKEPTPTWQRKRTRTRHLSMKEIVDIVWQVVVGKERQADVARHFRISQCTVSKHVVRSRKDPAYL